MNKQHTDEPIQGTPESPDLLNRDRFACQIASSMLSIPEASGFVLSLEGPWGYGKTSVLNLISKYYDQLPENERPIICTFNPWMIGNADTLVQSFLVQLAASIGLTDNVKSGAKAAKELLSYSSLFTALKFVPGAEPWASIIKGVIDAVGTASEKISDLRKLDIEKQRSAVVASLSELGRRIIVFIDDLDRLPPSEVFSMVRLVKAVGDFPGVVYVLCFEPEYVQETLKAYGIESANEYLDKIVQTRLTLPQISKDDLVLILNHEIEALPDAALKKYFPKTVERHSELYFGGLRNLIENPRDIKRLFNRIRFVEPGCRGEVNLADLIALEALALKAPSIYQHIRQCPSAYVGKEPGGITFKEPKDVVKSLEMAREKSLMLVSDRLQDSVRELVKELFPLLDEQSFGESGELARTRGLVSSPDRLAIALSAGLPSGEASYAAAIEFLRTPAIRSGTIQEVSKAGTLNRFVDHLRFAQKEIEVEDVLHVACVIGEILDTPNGAAAEEEQRGVFASGVCRNAWWLIKSMLGKLSSEQRKKVITKIILNKDLSSLGVQAISELHLQHGAFSDEKAWPEERRWVNAPCLQKLTSGWAQMIAKKVKEGHIFSVTKCGQIFFRLRKFQPKVLSSVICNVVTSDATFDQFALAIGQMGRDSVGGKYCKFSDDDLDGYGGANKLKARAKKRLRDPEVIGELKHIFTAMISGKNTYLSDGSEAENF